MVGAESQVSQNGRRLVPKANGKVCACGCGELVIRAQKNAIYASYECKMKVDAKRQSEKKRKASANTDLTNF